MSAQIQPFTSVPLETPFRLIRSETTYRGRVLNVRRDQVRLPDGRSVHLDVIEHAGSVTLVPVDEANRIWFVRQYRHAAGEYLLELPAGMLEEGEPPVQCARREIREEIGMAAGRLEQLGSFFLAPGYSTETMVVFLARDLHTDPLEVDADEIISVEQIPVDRVYRMSQAGEIRDAKSLAALHLAQPFLRGCISVLG